MFQRLSSLLFGEVEEVAAELKGARPCVTEADEEGWMLVHLPGSEGGVQEVTGPPLIAQSLPDSSQSNPLVTRPRPDCPSPVPHPPHKRRRTHRGRAGGAAAPCDPPFCPSASASHSGAVTPPRRSRPAPPCAPSGSPGSGKGATAEASPMEDLLIEHPSMSVYVSPGNFSLVSAGSLSVVGEESVVSLASSVSRVAEPAAAPAACGTGPGRASRGAAAQAGALAKVTQVGRVQRGKARVERRHLGRNRIQRQNRTREQVPRHASHARNAFLHQPGQRNICH